MLLHLAWFRRDTGEWLAEWQGTVPAPAMLDPKIVGDERQRVLNDLVHQLQARVVAGEFHGDGICDGPKWAACPAGGAVCIEVTQFGWPLGDHQFHVWNDVARSLDWPNERKYIEIRIDTLEVVSNTRSHRPIRDTVPGQHVIDVTDSPMGEFHGNIWGRFVWAGTRWAFEPSPARRRRRGQPIVPLHIRPALASAPLDGFLEYLEQRSAAAEVLHR